MSFTYPQDSDKWPMLLVTQAVSGQVFLPMHRWIFSEFYKKRRLDESNKLTELDFRKKFLFGDRYLFYRSRAKIKYSRFTKFLHSLCLSKLMFSIYDPTFSLLVSFSDSISNDISRWKWWIFLILGGHKDIQERK